MEEIEHIILMVQMTRTLAELNEFFIHNKSITKEQFMDLQLKVWREVKEAFNIKSSDKKQEAISR